MAFALGAPAGTQTHRSAWSRFSQESLSQARNTDPTERMAAFHQESLSQARSTNPKPGVPAQRRIIIIKEVA